MAFITYHKKYFTLNGNRCDRKTKENFMSFNKLSEYLDTIEFDKVIIVIRHAARPLNDWSKGVHITDYGISCSELAGEQLALIPDKFAYYATDTTRTKETALYISKGREDGVLKSINDVLPFGNIKNPEYIKNQANYEHYITTVGYNNTWYGFMYNGLYNDAFNNMFDVSYRFVDDAIRYTNKKYNIIVSHDQNIMPLAVCLAGRNLEFRPNKWLNFISGVVIIAKNPDNIYIPITGMSTGFN